MQTQQLYSPRSHVQQASSRAQTNDNSMDGFSIDGYDIEFTKQVALMPVDLVANTVDEPRAKKRSA